MSGRHDQKPWTEAERQAAATAYRAGASCSQVARKLGRTRNAVIGQLYRMGLSKSRPAADAARNRKAVDRPIRVITRQALSAEAKQQIAKAEKVGKAKVAAFAEPTSATNVRLMDRRRLQCSWPVGEPDRPANQMCCGGEVREGRSTSTETYCDHHAAIAMGRQPKKSLAQFATSFVRNERIDNAKLRVGPGGRKYDASPWDEGRAAA